MPRSSADAVESRSRRRVGTTIGGKYTLERVIGAGGMATVYLGVHRNGHRVAIKMLHPELSLEEGLAERFVREGYVANAIGHPGAVKVLDDDRTEEGAAFLVMELLEGETLHEQALRQGGRLAPREALGLGYELCDALAAAHARGVVHRDIKPENLFVTREGALKVLDFGIARVRDGSHAEATQTGRTLGTPAFMPPEQALGRTEEIDARTDVWAVGATLFWLISGQYVHEARTGPEFVVATATKPARSLATVAAETPAVIVEAIDRALRFAKEDRWPSAEAMRDALEVAFVEAFGAPITRAARTPVALGRLSPAKGMGSSPSGGAGEQVTLLAPSGDAPRSDAPRSDGPRSDGPRSDAQRSDAQRSDAAAGDARGSGDRGGARAATGGRISALSSAPTVEVEGAAGAPPRASRPGSGRPKMLGRLSLLAALCLAGGLSISFGLQRFFGRSPTPPVASAVGAASASGPASGCRTHRACRELLGRPAICRADHTACAPLEAEGCQILAQPGDEENEATLWFGAMFPMTGRAATEYGLASVNAVDLARRDFLEMANGLPSLRAGAPPRPLAVVACDDARDPARVAAHLVDGLGVPAILGFARSKEVLDLAASVFNPKGVLALASNTASMLRDIPHAPGGPRLVWRTTTSASMDVPAYAALLSEVVEPELRASGGALGANEAMRVALLRIGNTSGTSYADLLISRLRYNGKSVAENGSNFLVSVERDVEDPAQLAADVARIADEVVAFRPHVILGLLDTPETVIAIERGWPKEERFRPRYLMGSSLLSEHLHALVAQQPEMRKRMLGVNTPSSRASIAKFVSRYNEIYSPKVRAQTATDAPFDAFYLLAYAAFAVGDEAITGVKLARAIGRLVPPGVPIDVGPAGIHQALSALRNGQNVDLIGTTTTLDFDPETGDPTADFAVFCLSRAEKGRAVEVVETGLGFVARTGTLSGTLRCP